MLRIFKKTFRKRSDGEKKQKKITNLQRLKGKIKNKKIATSTDIKMLKSYEMSHKEIQNFLRRNKISTHCEVNFLMNLQQT